MIPSAPYCCRSLGNGRSCFSYIFEQRGSGAKEQRRFHISGPLQQLSPRVGNAPITARVRNAREIAEAPPGASDAPRAK